MNAVYVDKASKPVRLVASGNTDIEDVVVRSKVEFREQGLNKTAKGFDKLHVENKQAANEKMMVNLLSGTYESIDVKGAGVDLVASAATKITNLDVESNGTRILGKGAIKKAFVKADNVSFDQKPAKLDVAKNVKRPNIKVVATTSSKKSSGGGGGGGGGSSRKSSSSSDDSSTTPPVNKLNTAAELVSAIQNNSKTTINLEGNISGDVVANRRGSRNLTINFNGYNINGNLDLTASQVKTITLNAGSSGKITGDFIIDARNASVINNVTVGGKAILENVAYNSYDAKKPHGQGIDVKGRARVVVAKGLTDIVVNIKSTFPVVLDGEIEEVNVETAGASAIVQGIIEKINVKKGADKAEIQIAEEAKVANLKADEPVVVLAENTETIDIHVDETGEATVTKKVAHLVVFDENGGDSIPSPSFVYVENGQELDMLPSTPVRASYVFTGWMTEKTGGAAITESTVVTAGMTAYAQWEVAQVNTYTVIFESNGGSYIRSISGIESGKMITLPKKPLREGYEFKGWFIDDGSFVDEFSEGTIVKSNMTLYAKWQVAEELVAKVDHAKAYGNSLVNVYFEFDVNPGAAMQVENYKIVEKSNSSKEIDVLSVEVFDGDDVFLKTQPMEAGKAYTVFVSGTQSNFTGLAKNSHAPSIEYVKGTDTNEVTVGFEDAYINRSSAENVANYSLEEGTVVKAEANFELDKVTLTIDGMTSTKPQKLTVSNIVSTDDVVMLKESKSFGPKIDNAGPVIGDIKTSEHNNVEVLVVFDDAHGIDKSTAENVSNYKIDGLEILSAKAIFVDDYKDDYYDKVILTTSEQVKSKIYTLKVLHMLDGSNSANAIAEGLSEKFVGGVKEEDAPEVDLAGAINLNEIEIVFEEVNALDPASALDEANYTFLDDKLDVLDVRFYDESENGNTYSYGLTGVKDHIAEDDDKIRVILTVSEMEEKENYKLIINNIADNFGNQMDKPEMETIRVNDEVDSYYQIKSISANDLEEIIVEFEGTVEEKSAEDMTNYVIDGGIGPAKRAIWDSLSKDRVYLVVPKLTNGKVYTLTVNNVENDWGYVCKDAKHSFIASSSEPDYNYPEVEHVSYSNKGELSVTFNEAMRASVGSDKFYVSVSSSTGPKIKLALVRMTNDNRTLVFNAYKDITGTLLPLATEFQIDTFYGITDLAGYAVDYDAGSKTFITDAQPWNPANTDDVLKLTSLSKESGNSIKATFTESIRVSRKDGTSIVESGQLGETIVYIPYDSADLDDLMDAYMPFTMKLLDDETLLFTKITGAFPDESIEMKFDFTGLSIDEETDTSNQDVQIIDILGRACEDKVNSLNVDNHDEIPPVLERIQVVDKSTLLLHYSEKMKTTGAYKIMYEDKEDGYKEKIINSSDMTVVFNNQDAADVVKIMLNGDLALKNQTYDLEITISPRDLANNKMADYAVIREFVGTSASNVLAVESLSKISGNTIKAVFSDAIQLKQFDGAPIVETGKIGESVVYIPYDSLDSDDLIDDYLAFTMKLMDDRTVIFTKVSGTFPSEEIELRFNFARLSSDKETTISDTDVEILDILGRKMDDKVTTLHVDNVDDVHPVLEKIEAMDKLTILLKYSEKLKTTGAYKISYEGDAHVEQFIESSDMTVEFDNEDTADTVKIILDVDAGLKDQQYKLIVLASPRDLANNKMVDQNVDRVFMGTSDTDVLEIDTLSKMSANSIKVVFTDAIQLKQFNGISVVETGQSGETVVYVPYDSEDTDDLIDDYLAFTMKITDDKTLVFTKVSGIFPNDEIELRFNFSRLSSDDASTISDEDVQVLDILGRATYDKVNKISVANNDDTQPTLEKIEAIDKLTIRLHYSEKLKTTGMYKITYQDDSNEDKMIDSSNMTVVFEDEEVADVVRIMLTSDFALKNQKYNLEVMTSPRDMTNRKMLDQDVIREFMGVSTNPEIKMVAAIVEGPNNIKIINDADDFNGETWVVVSNDRNSEEFVVSNNSDTGELDLEIGLYNTLLSENSEGESVSYAFEIYDKNPSGSDAYPTATGTQTFTGKLVETPVSVLDTSLVTTTTSSAVTISCSELDIDEDDYIFKLVDEDNKVINLKIGQTIVEENGNVVLKTDLDDSFNLMDLEGKLHKIVAYPLDSHGNNTGVIEIITEAFKWEFN